MLSNRLVLLYIVVLTLGFGQMFALLSSIQQIYDIGFGMAESFPLWFLVGGLISGVGTVLERDAGDAPRHAAHRHRRLWRAGGI